MMVVLVGQGGEEGSPQRQGVDGQWDLQWVGDLGIKIRQQ